MCGDRLTPELAEQALPTHFHEAECSLDYVPRDGVGVVEPSKRVIESDIDNTQVQPTSAICMCTKRVRWRRVQDEWDSYRNVTWSFGKGAMTRPQGVAPRWQNAVRWYGTVVTLPVKLILAFKTDTFIIRCNYLMFLKQLAVVRSLGLFHWAA